MDLPFESANKPVQPQDVLRAERNPTKDVQNTMAITLFVYPKFFVLEPNTKTTKIGKKLIIEKAKCRITEIDLHELPSAEQYEQKKTFSGFLGIITIIDKAFLMFVDECNQVCTLENSDIFLITSLAFIPFENENEIFAQTVGNNYISYIENIRKLFLPGYYFSYTYDLSLSKAAQQTRKVPDPRFVWNTYLCKELISQKIDKKWIVPLIQGYIGHFTVYLMGKKLDYYLISRRSRFRGGTRYNARGIDDDGNVANFVESEQIIYYNDFCCSHVQVRGSVPVFWAQRGLTAAMRFTRTYEYTNDAFLKHMHFLNSTYGRVLFVNLMSLTKTGEQLITDALEEQVKRSELPTLRYEFFDFHYACKNQRFERVNPLLKKLQPINENFKFYAEDRAKNVLLTQKGVIRSNCLDCLDRTNVFQSKVAIKIFEVIMKNLGVDLIAALGQDVLSLIDNDDPKAQHPFILNFKIVWADNGDQISRHYAGTGSTISSVTRYGKGGLMGLLSHGMTTLNRFYIGNWEDQTKQECIDMILGEHTDIVNLFGENLDRELKLRQKEFCAFDKLGIFVCTWNVNGAPPHAGLDTSKLLDFGGNANPDIIVISLQEIVVLNATNVLVASNENSVNQWVNFFTERVKKIDKNYTLVVKKDLVGLLMIIFAHERVKNRINKVNSETARAGMMNTLGNKGAVVVKFHFDDTSLVFLNCHLPADDATVTDRIAVIDDIHKNTFQADTLGKKKEERIALLDYKFLMGDMNFRMACQNQEARHLIECYNNAVEAGNAQQAEDMLKTLFSFDELQQFRKNSEYLANYDEPKINFLPTYKYDIGTNIYDTSKKQRTPAWCDRILLWADESLKHEQTLYTRRELMESDHRPVVTYVTLEVKKVDQLKKEEIEKQIYEVLKSKPMEELGIDEVCATDADGPIQAQAVLAEPK